MIPKETVDKILDAARIEEVIGDFVSLKRRGASFVACCPFHNEKTPSFYVTPSKGIYKCFGCGKSGTAVKFIMEHEGLSYADALRYLARKYGIEVVEKEESAEEIQARQKTESLYLVSEFAQKYFSDNLGEGEGRHIGYAYFKSRGLEDETIVKYGLGWSRRDRDDLAKAARAAGYKEEYLVETGLCYKNDDGSLTDRFYDRVMFPIHSASGRVIAFGGRTLQGGHPAMKYVNTPTTEIYAKERSLYGIWFAKSEIARKDKCFLVEGYLDVLSMHQLGIANTVASSGTSLTVEQIRLIHKFTENVTIMYDGDSAGVNAAMRGIGLVLQEGLNVKVVLIPDGDDPDSFARKHTLEEVEQFIASHERDFISFKTDLLLESAEGDPLKKAALINDVADTIALIPDAIKRIAYAQSSSQTFGMDSQILFDRINSTREKFLTEQLKSAEREERREARLARQKGESENSERQEEGAVMENPTDKMSAEGSQVVLENKLLASSEREFVWFILNYGLELLSFSQDSEFRENDGVSVADFIRGSLESEKIALANSVYRKIYDAFFDLYDEDESLTQQDIIQKLITGPDQDMAEQVLELTQEKHLLTINTLKNSITKIETILSHSVPRAIMVYQTKRLKDKQNGLTQLLATPEGAADAEKILIEIQNLAIVRKAYEEKLGRVQ